METAVAPRGHAEQVRASAVPHTEKEQGDVPKRAQASKEARASWEPSQILLFLDRVELDDLHPLADPRDLHLTDGALCTVIKSQLLQVVSGNIRKAAVFEVA